MVNIARGKVAAHGLTLSANTTLTVNIDGAWNSVQVVVLSGTAPIYYTTDGSEPSATGTSSYVIPGGVVAVDDRGFHERDTETRTVKLRSSAAAGLSVQRGS